MDENLFTIYFQTIINNSKQSRECLDDELREILEYWLPIGSFSDSCLNLAVANNLLKSSVLLLIERKFYQRSFDLLFDSLQKNVSQTHLCMF